MPAIKWCARLTSSGAELAAGPAGPNGQGPEAIVVAKLDLVQRHHFILTRFASLASSDAVARLLGESVVDHALTTRVDWRTFGVVLSKLGLQAALRRYRDSEEGRARRKKTALLTLCDPIKNPQFTHANPLGRPGHSM